VARANARHHGANSDLSTPHSFFRPLHLEFGFTLDACAVEWNAKVLNYLSPLMDGLRQDWGKHIVWLNPPFGKGIDRWVRKAYESSLAGATVVCLLPAQTDSWWWHAYATKGEIRYIYMDRCGSRNGMERRRQL
jgi:phage N-6-adenine-methyltransferase